MAAAGNDQAHRAPERQILGTRLRPSCRAEIDGEHGGAAAPPRLEKSNWRPESRTASRKPRHPVRTRKNP